MAEINNEEDARLSAKVSELINKCDILSETAKNHMAEEVSKVETLKNETSEILETFKEKLSSGEYKGEQGEKGDKGERGEKGEKGDKGDKGDISDLSQYFPLEIENGGTGANNVSQIKLNLFLDNVDNTRDINKPISIDVQNALNSKQPIGDYATNSQLDEKLSLKQDIGDYATNEALIDGLNSKQPLGNYATNEALSAGLASKQPIGNYLTSADISNKSPMPTLLDTIGQVINISVSRFYLPPQGIWLYHFNRVNIDPAVVIAPSYTGIAQGGTLLDNSGLALSGWAIRIR